MIGKILQLRSIRLIDVSPGPMLFDAMADAADFQRRLAFDAAAYFQRLDHFVAKYADGVPAGLFASDACKARIIPNGVKLPPRFVRAAAAGDAIAQKLRSGFGDWHNAVAWLPIKNWNF